MNSEDVQTTLAIITAIEGLFPVGEAVFNKINKPKLELDLAYTKHINPTDIVLQSTQSKFDLANDDQVESFINKYSFLALTNNSPFEITHASFIINEIDANGNRHTVSLTHIPGWKKSERIIFAPSNIAGYHTESIFIALKVNKKWQFGAATDKKGNNLQNVITPEKQHAFIKGRLQEIT